MKREYLLRPALVFFAGFLSTGCGETDGDSGAGGSAGTGGSVGGSAGTGGSGGSTAGGSGGSAGTGGAVSGDCPATPPIDSSACTPPWTADSGGYFVSVHCSWGDDPRPCVEPRRCAQTGNGRFPLVIRVAVPPLSPLSARPSHRPIPLPAPTKRLRAGTGMAPVAGAALVWAVRAIRTVSSSILHNGIARLRL
jgi:hypothetical protein